MGYVTYYVEGLLLWAAFLVLISAIAIRLAIKIFVLIRSEHGRKSRWRHLISVLGRLLVPYHMAATKRPFFTGLRYIFHACLIAVPVWFSGHIVLWEESRFEWYWTPLPDVWVDSLTVMLLALALIFLIRRIIKPEPIKYVNASNWLLTVFAILPFATGFLLTHGYFDSIAFFSDNLLTIHIFTAELMFLMIAVLFLRTRIAPQTCIGCAACELNCPTGALENVDEGDQRIFSYTPYRCIGCGSCVKSCPEGAVALNHYLSPGGIIKSFFKQTVRTIPLQVCDHCKRSFAPTSQLEKIRRKVDGNFTGLCERCKEESNAIAFYKKVF